MQLPEHLTTGTLTAWAEQNGVEARARIFLDGEEVKGVIEANTKEGWLIRVKRDENGALIIVGDELAIERLTGKVTAVLI